MALQQEQLFTVIVLQWDDAIFDVNYTVQPDGRVATMKIVKKLDPTWFIVVDKFNSGISWNGNYPVANKITQNKGLTVMEIG